jgi:hypothetical protein
VLIDVFYSDRLHARDIPFCAGPTDDICKPEGGRGEWFFAGMGG